MILFYYPEIESGTITLPPEESRHCVRVLRLGPGDVVYLTDGIGKLAETRILHPDHKKCIVELISIKEEKKQAFHLHLAVAPTKNINRFEWFLEKATEIGVNEITPLICENSERTVIKAERLNKVLVAAMNQSLKTFLPVLNESMTFDQFMNNNFKGEKFIAYCSENYRTSLKEQYNAKNDALILIGPEGDFSEKEIAQALANNFQAVSLGNSRLRTETAAIVACHTVNLINE